MTMAPQRRRCRWWRPLTLLSVTTVLLVKGVKAIKRPFATWTQSDPQTQPMPLNELAMDLVPRLAVTEDASSSLLEPYETIVICETHRRNNETTTIALADARQATVEDLVQSLPSSSASSLLPTLWGLRHELENKTTAGSRTSSVFFGQAAAPPSIQLPTLSTRRRVLLLRLGTSAVEARKVGDILANLVQSLSPPPAAASNQRKRRTTTTSSCAILLPLSMVTTSSSTSDAVLTPLEELATALWLGLYDDKRFRGTEDDARQNGDNGETDNNNLQTVDLVFYGASSSNNNNNPHEPPFATLRRIQNELRQGRVMAEAVSLCRDVVNAPHNVLNAHSLAATAHAVAQRNAKTLTCRILNAHECERLGMGAFLGVARGSETSAQFLHVTYRPPYHKRSSAMTGGMRRLGIVGKGLLFDTGGYNIKTGMAGMTYMKMDCGGAAAVLGAAHAIAALEPENVEVHFVIAACENMINEKAMVPGDILTASNGKTIEVLNTDAEGRLTMADALVYADQTLHCEEIVELSTLTGACVSALGSAMAGLWTHSDEMAAQLAAASRLSGEKTWRMPMEREYAEELHSKIATLKNIGGRFGGAITAALFLQHFVDEQRVQFAHVDMAGPVWNYKAHHATGWGVRFLTEWVHQRRGGGGGGGAG